MRKRFISVLSAVSILAASISGIPVFAEESEANPFSGRTYYTLSGNTWSDADKAIYANWDTEITLKTLDTNNPECSWITDVDGYDKTLSNPANLTNGNLSNNSNGVWGNYNGGTAAAQFDLGTVYPIDRVDVIMRDHSATDYRDNTVRIEVYTSTDGTNFTKAAEQEASHNNDVKNNNSDKTGLYFNSIKFPMTKARYVQVISIGKTGSGKQQVFCEEAVFGYDVTFEGLTELIAENEAFLANESVGKYYTDISVENLKDAVKAAKECTAESSANDICTAMNGIENTRAALDVVYQRLVVSGNNFDSGDKQYYKNSVTPAVELVNDDNAASYSWEQSHDPNLTNTDSETNTQRASRNDSGNELIGGGLLNCAGEYATDTVWGKKGEAPAVAIFDLKENKTIDRVDVFSSHEQYKALGSVKIEVSTDGINYTETAKQKAAGEIINVKEKQIVYRTQADFAPVDARYVKISFYPNTSAQLTNINEVIIFGIRPDFGVLRSELSDKINKYSKEKEVIKEYATDASYSVFEKALANASEVLASGKDDIDAILNAKKNIDDKLRYVVYEGDDYAEGVLTGNKAVTGRYSRYENINTGLSYTIEGDQISSGDTNCEKLTDGNFSTQTFGKWNGDQVAVINIDAGKKMYFTGADLYAYYKNKSHGVADLKVEVSLNGTDYQTVTETSERTLLRDSEANLVKVTGDKYNVGVLGEDFAPVCGRYMRITTQKTGYQQILAEMVVKGFDIPVRRSPKAENIRFFNEYGDEFIYYSGEASLNASAEVYDIDAVLTVAQYDENNRLKQVFTKNGTYSELGEAYTISMEIVPKNAVEGDTFKAFVFDSLDGMKPLGKVKQIGKRKENEQGILSGNKTDGTEVVYDTADGYDFVKTGKDASADLYEASAQMLFDGDKTTLVSGDTLNIKIHFKDTVKVEKATIRSMCSSDSYMSDFDIYASLDGINYELVTNNSNTIPKTRKRVMPVSASLPGVVYAKDIKITARKADGVSKMEIAELELYGKPAEFMKERMENYSYETEVPFKTENDIISQDASLSALSDNDRNTAVASSGDYVSLIYDLGGIYQPEDITIYGSFAGGEILTSIDGANYFQSCLAVPKNGSATGYAKAENNARYVKIVIRKGDLSQISLKEIVVKGRKLYDESEEAGTAVETVPVRAELKANNILYLDWSDYNDKKNNAEEYQIFVEKNTFSSVGNKTLKQVYVNNNSTPVSAVKGKSCRYIGLEPNRDYYIAVVPVVNGKLSTESFTPVKITTHSQTGADTLSGIFCMNEYPRGGSAHVDHEDENANMKIKLKLINDMENLSKTRYWDNSEGMLNMYGTIGFGAVEYAASDKFDLAKEYGIYSYVGNNEPEIQSKDGVSEYYFKHPDEYYEIIKSRYNTVKADDARNLLAEASICGTDKLDFVKNMYEAAKAKGENYSDYFDIFDVHAYVKDFENKNNDAKYYNYLDAETAHVPEHLFYKIDKIREMMNTYGDEKPIMFTELGWSTIDGKSSTGAWTNTKVTPEQQANFLARTYIIGAAEKIDNIFWYAFQDEGVEDSSASMYMNYERGFGIVDWYGNPKPAYYAYYTLAKLLKNAYFVGKIETVSHPNYGVTFYDSEKDMYLTALWNASGSGASVSFATKDSKAVKLDINGNAEYISSGSLQIGSAPVYIYTTDCPSVR